MDYTSSALVRLSLGMSGSGRNYHLVNPSSPSFAQLLHLAKAEGYRIHVLPEEQWENAISGGKGGIQQNPIAAYQLFIPRQVLTSLVQEQSAEFCHNTLQDLQGTGITCPPIDQARMHRYLQHFTSTGFLPPASSANS